MREVQYESFAVNRTRDLLRQGLFVLGFSAVCFLLTLAFPSLWWLFGFVGCLLLFKALALLMAAVSSWQGHKGEQRVVKTLGDLGDGCILVSNWVDSRSRRKSGDVDLIVLGPFGAAVLEIKTLTGKIKCVGHDWYYQRKNGSWGKGKSYSRQLQGNVDRVSKRLKTPSHGFLVFNDRASLKIDNPQCAVIRRNQILEAIQALPVGNFVAEKLLEKLTATGPSVLTDKAA